VIRVPRSREFAAVVREGSTGERAPKQDSPPVADPIGRVNRNNAPLLPSDDAVARSGDAFGYCVPERPGGTCRTIWSVYDLLQSLYSLAAVAINVAGRQTSITPRQGVCGCCVHQCINCFEKEQTVKIKILSLIAVALTAGAMWGFAQQPSAQTSQTCPWIGCPCRNVSGAACTNDDPTTPTWYHRCHGPFDHNNRYIRRW
jgi:hypothetical protein